MPFSLTVGHISPIISIIFGVLVLTNPKLLSTLVGIYLILVGLLGIGIIRF